MYKRTADAVWTFDGRVNEEVRTVWNFQEIQPKPKNIGILPASGLWTRWSTRNEIKKETKQQTTNL